jgi:segregation and condensation protein B
MSLAADFARRAAHLKAVVPKLRAKGAGAAVDMFLTHDAATPSALPLPDRAARRLCDRLVDQGAVRELTGRDTFQLYGVCAMAKYRSEPEIDRKLSDLAPDLRWREWMPRIEAVLFASASPVPREDLTRVVGQGASVDFLVEDLSADIKGTAFKIALVAGGWMFRTRPTYSHTIRAAANVGEQLLDLTEFDVAVLAAIAYHQPISRDLIGRLHVRGLIGTGPTSPRRGALYTSVMTEQFLVGFGLESLRALPDREQLEDAGIVRELQQ